MVVFWPLGIWMASQSRVNVNSVFSYMALPFANYYATKGENDEIRMTNDETISNDRMTIGSTCVLPSFLRHSAFVLRHLFNTRPACNACRFSVSQRIRLPARGFSHRAP